MTKSRHYSITARLVIFAEWWDDKKGWFTAAQFAKILDCDKKSIHPAFSWLRRNGYLVTARWVWTKKCYLYNVKCGQATVINRQASRCTATLDDTRTLLRARVERAKRFEQPKRTPTRWTTSQPARRKAA